MSYNICHIGVYIYLTYNCDKIKTKITVLIKGCVHLNPFSLNICLFLRTDITNRIVVSCSVCVCTRAFITHTKMC